MKDRFQEPSDNCGIASQKAKKRMPIIGFYKIWVVLTYLSAITAMVGMYFALRGNIPLAMFCLMFCGLCDMLDGPAARRRKRNDRERSFGIQIDALADLVSFGVYPVVLGFAAEDDCIFRMQERLQYLSGNTDADEWLPRPFRKA